MKLAQGEVQLASYGGRKNGSPDVTLTYQRVVFADGTQETHYPLDKITEVMVGFRRKRGDIISGIILALFVFAFAQGLDWLQHHLPQTVDSLVNWAAAGEKPEKIDAVHSELMQRAQNVAAFFPILWGLVALSGLYALWLIGAGIWGETRLEIRLFAVTRLFRARGRDQKLLEFGEQVAQRLK